MSDRIVEFKSLYRAGKDPVDMVLVAPAGPGYEKTRTWHRIKDIKPHEGEMRNSDSGAFMRKRWEMIEPAYEAWKKGGEIPENGTPLAAWGGVTADQVNALKAMAVYTVEQVAEMGDAACQELRIPNARQLPGLAKKFLENENSSVKDAKIAELEERMAVMAEMLEEQATQADKPKRGRPRKSEAA